MSDAPPITLKGYRGSGAHHVSKASYQVYREHQDQALRARKGAVLTVSPNLIPRWGRDGKRPEVRFIEQKARFSASEGQKSHHTAKHKFVDKSGTRRVRARPAIAVSMVTHLLQDAQTMLAPSVFAVIRTGGKQYRVSPNDLMKVEKIEAEPGSTITFTDILAVGSEGNLTLGSPVVAGATVTAEVIAQDPVARTAIVST
eukprot:gene2747-2787_t